MVKSEGRMANLPLRFATPLSGLRRIPLAGDLLRWCGRRLVRSDTLVRVQIKNGPAIGLSIRVNPRTGHVKLNPSPSATAIIVEAVSLDHYTAEHPAPDFLKCDVEGAELAVFEGAARLLRAKHPILLVGMHSSENHRLLSGKFVELGYICTALDENHVLALPK